MEERESATYIFKTVFAELCKEMQETQDTEPGAPKHHFIHGLHIHDAKDKDEFVEHEIPELVFDVLLLRHPELPKDKALD